MFYVTKPVLKHPPRAVMVFFPYINSSYLLDKILAIKKGLFSKVIVPFFVRGGVFVLKILSLVAILSNLPQNEHEHWTIPIWSDKNNWPIFVQQLFAAIFLRSADQSPHFPLHLLSGRFLLSSFNISTWAKNKFCEGIEYIPLLIHLNLRKFTLQCWEREQCTFRLPSRWLWRGRPHQGFPVVWPQSI